MREETRAAQGLIVRPQIFTLRNVGEAEKLLAFLVSLSVDQRERQEVPALSEATHVRYELEPPRKEYWQTARDTYQLGRGDCEDLSIYLCADMQLRGLATSVRLKNVGYRKWHALVFMLCPKRGPIWIDPSKARGM